MFEINYMVCNKIHKYPNIYHNLFFLASWLITPKHNNNYMDVTITINIS
jgi:hypothetical protein